MHIRRRFTKLLCHCLLAACVVALQSSTMKAQAPVHNVVLVHGAWVNGSSWSKVIPLLQAKIVKPRILLFGAVVTVGIAIIHFSRFTLDADYNHYALGRALQGLGYAFFFVPLSVISYSQLSPDQNNKASSLTNFFRNWGGSFGIAFVSTMTERRQNYHQAILGQTLVPSNPILQERVQRLTSYF